MATDGSLSPAASSLRFVVRNTNDAHTVHWQDLSLTSDLRVYLLIIVLVRRANNFLRAWRLATARCDLRKKNKLIAFPIGKLLMNAVASWYNSYNYFSLFMLVVCVLVCWFLWTKPRGNRNINTRDDTEMTKHKT